MENRPKAREWEWETEKEKRRQQASFKATAEDSTHGAYVELIDFSGNGQTADLTQQEYVNPDTINADNPGSPQIKKPDIRKAAEGKLRH